MSAFMATANSSKREEWKRNKKVAAMSVGFLGMTTLMVMLVLRMEQRLQEVAEMVAECVTAWITKKTSVYFLLNVVIVTITLQSGPLAAQSSEKLDAVSVPTQNQPPMSSSCLESDSFDGFRVPESERVSVSLPEKPSSSLRRSTSSLSDFCKSGVAAPSANAGSVCCSSGGNGMVVFEICEVAGEDCFQADDGEDSMAEAALLEMEMGNDDLFFKSENFIKNFYKQLEMQREDSWKRFLEIQKRSC